MGRKQAEQKESLYDDDEEIIEGDEDYEEEPSDFEEEPESEDKMSDLIERDLEDESYEDDPTNWGTQKETYHKDSDESGGSSSEEEQEQEAIEIYKQYQKKMDSRDYLEENIQEVQQVLETEAPQSVQDFMEIKGLVEELKTKASQLLKKQYLFDVENIDKIMKFKGVSFLSVQNQLMQGYLMCLLFYLHMAEQGVYLKNHPVIQKLIKLKQLILELSKHDKNFQKQMSLFMQQQIQKMNKEKKEKEVKKKKKKEKKFPTKPKKEKKEVIFDSTDEEDKRIKGEKFDFDEKNLSGSMDSMDMEEHLSEEGGQEDDFYRTVKQNAENNKQKQKLEKKREKKEQKEQIQQEFNIREVGDNDARKINYNILKNRGGLFRKRKKIDQNGRVKHKLKYQKALVKLKSKGQNLRPKQIVYKGETLGIKGTLIRGVSLKNN